MHLRHFLGCEELLFLTLAWATGHQLMDWLRS